MCPCDEREQGDESVARKKNTRYTRQPEETAQVITDIHLYEVTINITSLHKER